ncbi:hypothetical protein PMAYCL1PPCAC_25728, partial [Pristionchus mayeri]
RTLAGCLRVIVMMLSVETHTAVVLKSSQLSPCTRNETKPQLIILQTGQFPLFEIIPWIIAQAWSAFSTFGLFLNMSKPTSFPLRQSSPNHWPLRVSCLSLLPSAPSTSVGYARRKEPYIPPPGISSHGDSTERSTACTL